MLQIFKNYSPKWRWLGVDIYQAAKQWDNIHHTHTKKWMISSFVTDANWDAIFPELLWGKWQRIFGVWLANQRAPSMLSTVLVYTKLSYSFSKYYFQSVFVILISWELDTDLVLENSIQ